jgi:hypothetical protein
MGFEQTVDDLANFLRDVELAAVNGDLAAPDARWKCYDVGSNVDQL